MSNDVTTNHAATDTAAAIFSPDSLRKLHQFAEVMAQGVATLPKHLAGKPADCLAIAMQAAQWGMNPYAVAQKTHLVNGVLGYEAQLVNAVITSSRAVQGRFHYEYGGDWSRIVGQPMDKRDETGLYIRVGAVLRGETEITWGEPLYLVEAVTRNSPLWKSKPQQQLAYLGVKYWGRMYCPEVILGVYTPDEFDDTPRAERDITPRSTGDLNSLINAESQTIEQPSDDAELVARLQALIDVADSVESATKAGEAVALASGELQESTFRSLRTKAGKVYKHHDARRQIEAAINSLDANAPDAAETFKKVEADLQKLKGPLGEELYEGFALTLGDMRAEYQ